MLQRKLIFSNQQKKDGFSAPAATVRKESSLTHTIIEEHVSLKDILLCIYSKNTAYLGRIFYFFRLESIFFFLIP